MSPATDVQNFVWNHRCLLDTLQPGQSRLRKASVATARSPKINNICAHLCLCHALGVPLAGSTCPSDIGAPQALSWPSARWLHSQRLQGHLRLLLPLKSTASDCWQTHTSNCSLDFTFWVYNNHNNDTHLSSLRCVNTYIAFTDTLWVFHIYILAHLILTTALEKAVIVFIPKKMSHKELGNSNRIAEPVQHHCLGPYP